MSIQPNPDRARADVDGLFVWLIVIGLALAVLVIAGRYSAFIPQDDRTLNQPLRLESNRYRG
jgi:hypothetical protein